MSVNLEEIFNTQISTYLKEAIYTSASVADSLNINIYLIGGIVRDIILKNNVKDIDIAVEGDAIEFCKILTNKTTAQILSVQENLKTAKVRFNNSIEIDFASTRKERYSKPGILPEAFDFGCSLKEDVKRRDFSINTLALKLSGDNKFSLIDYHNGYNDIKNKKIKILHNKSFIDDPSRIIRALKFKKRFDFDFEENTYILMQKYLSNIYDDIPLERIKNEFKQYFSINKTDLYKEIINSNAFKLITDTPIAAIDEKNLSAVKLYNLYEKNELWLVYFAILLSKSYKEKLNLTSFEKKVISDLRELLSSNINENENLSIYNLFQNKSSISTAAYYVLTKDNSVIKYLDNLSKIEIHINGNDLIQLGLIPSPYFNKLFKIILKEKLNGKLVTKEDEISYLKQLLKKTE